MRSLPDHASSFASALAGLCLFGIAGTAHAASSDPCEVPLVPDPSDATYELKVCIQQINDGEASEIVFEGPQSYLVSVPLQIERDVVIRGVGQVLKADSSFSGTSMLEVGAICPGPNCGTPAKVRIQGLELSAKGEPDVRGIDLQPNNTLILEEVLLHDLSTQTSGGCIRAQAASSVFMEGGRLEDCFASNNGGAVFTEAEETFIDETRIRRNEATLGGGVYFGATGTFMRKLRLWEATLSDNVADRGGAVYTQQGSHLHTGFDDSVVRDNDATEQGGGLYGGADIRDSTFTGNTAGENGGGALLRTASQVVRSTFRANESWRGGGISVLVVTNEDVDIVGSTFVANQVGTIYPGTPWGAGVLVSRGINPPPSSTTFIRNSTFSENVASGNGIGGGLGVSGATVVAEHLTFLSLIHI